MAKFDHPYLDLARMEALRRVHLTPRGAVEGTLAGPHQSHYRGSAVEFADYRQYVEGDDIYLYLYEGRTYIVVMQQRDEPKYCDGGGGFSIELAEGP